MFVKTGPSFAANTPRMAFAGASAPNSAAPACDKTTPKFAASGDSVQFSSHALRFGRQHGAVRIPDGVKFTLLSNEISQAQVDDALGEGRLNGHTDVVKSFLEKNLKPGDDVNVLRDEQGVMVSVVRKGDAIYIGESTPRTSTLPFQIAEAFEDMATKN